MLAVSFIPPPPLAHTYTHISVFATFACFFCLRFCSFLPLVCVWLPAHANGRVDGLADMHLLLIMG